MIVEMTVQVDVEILVVVNHEKCSKQRAATAAMPVKFPSNLLEVNQSFVTIVSKTMEIIQHPDVLKVEISDHNQTSKTAPCTMQYAIAVEASVEFPLNLEMASPSTAAIVSKKEDHKIFANLLQQSIEPNILNTKNNSTN